MRYRVMQHVPPTVRMNVRMPDRAFFGTTFLRYCLCPVLLRYPGSFYLALLLKGLQRGRHDKLSRYMAWWH